MNFEDRRTNPLHSSLTKLYLATVLSLSLSLSRDQLIEDIYTYRPSSNQLLSKSILILRSAVLKSLTVRHLNRLELTIRRTNDAQAWLG